MRRILLAATALVAFNTAAMSADMPVKAPAYAAPAPLFNWTGFYVGAVGGYAWGHSRDLDPGIPNDSGDFRMRGGTAGGTLGVNWQAGNIVLGIEGDLAWADFKGSQGVTCGSTCFTKNDYFHTARGRAGIASGPWLFYVTGGAAFTNYKIHSGNGVLQISDDKTGWTVGGGVENAITNNWSWKIEYLYAAFGSSSNAPGGTGQFHASKDNLSIVRAGINYRFGTN
jgi:outer membrane immunogenic protein